LSTGLIALLDDIVALSKMAAASLDDVAAQSAKAGSKAAGIVIDDAAVTPRYVVGLAAERELPIIRKIAVGSLKNKLLFLLPGALVLSHFAPWAITPLLMMGGVYLCLEGYHKMAERFHPPRKTDETALEPGNPKELENQRIASAIRTDFILSAEIMAITLAGATGSSLGVQAAILAAVGVGMTILVYGVVGIIVKADDAGLAMAQSANGQVRALGRGIVSGMPFFLKMLSQVGMLAMLWVGGGILIHGLHVLGVSGPEHLIHQAASVASGALNWLLQASLSGLVGLCIGGLTDRLLKPFIKH
jgi:predicted DNA repair protein MutK